MERQIGRRPGENPWPEAIRTALAPSPESPRFRRRAVLCRCRRNNGGSASPPRCSTMSRSNSISTNL